MTQPDLFGPQEPRPPSVRGSATSAEAAEAIRSAARTLRLLVLRFLASCGSLGATDETVSRVLQLNPSTARPRRIELVERGLVEDSGETCVVASGRRATVWRVTEAGRQALEGER